MLKRILVIILACVVGIICWRSSGKKPKPELQNELESRPNPVAREEMDWNREIRDLPNRDSLDSLRDRLSGMTPAEAVAEISAFLQTGKDAKTGLEFQIGSGGKMTGYPTLRVFLLDLLLEIDPSAAARISREVLGEKTTADEWAISLRNVARGEAAEESRDYLRAKAEELITDPEWQVKPSIGYLNAFDVFVHTEATESTPLLSDLIQRKDRRDLAHAAFLTLDRLVQRKPADMMDRLLRDKELRESRPEMVAQQYARADLRDNMQRNLVKSWLLDPERSPTELRNFCGVFPNNNKMISQNLLTSEGTTTGTDLREHDLQVLSLVRGWQQDPAFDAVSDYLEVMERRLVEFTKDAGTNLRD